MTDTTAIPCPRFELRWEPINEPAFEGDGAKMFTDNGIPVPVYDWKCTYSLVIPLQAHDMRTEEHGREMRLKIHATRATNFGRSPVLRSGNIELPYRDSHHVQWDHKALGADIPIVAICGDEFMIVEKWEQP